MIDLRDFQKEIKNKSKEELKKMYKIEEFKGHKIIKLQKDENDFGFSFGVAKGKLILENIEAIKKFVEENS